MAGPNMDSLVDQVAAGTGAPPAPKPAPAPDLSSLVDKVAATQAPAPKPAAPDFSALVDQVSQSQKPLPPLATFRRAGTQPSPEIGKIFSSAVQAVGAGAKAIGTDIGAVPEAAGKAYQAEKGAEAKAGIGFSYAPLVSGAIAGGGQALSALFDAPVQAAVAFAKGMGADDSTVERMTNDLNALMQSEMGRAGDQGAIKSGIESYLKEKAPEGTDAAFREAAAPLGDTSPVADIRAKAKQLEDRFFQQKQSTTADRLDTIETGKQAVANIGDAATREKLIHYQEQPTKIELTPEEKQKFDTYVQPIIRAREQVDANIAQLVGYEGAKPWIEAIDQYAPRYVKDKASTIDWLVHGIGRGLGARGLTTSAGFQKSRTVTAPMIESPHIPYYKDVVVNNLVRLEEAKRVHRNLQMLVDLQNDPELSALREPVSGAFAHPDWKQIDVPQLRGFRWHPKIAAAINDMYTDFKRTDDGADFLERANRILVGSLFIQPWSHAFNAFNDFLISKGLFGTLTGLPETAQAFSRALKDVKDLSPEYRKNLRAGSSLQYGDVVTENFVKFLTNKLGEDAKTNASAWEPVARAFGYADPVRLVRGIYSAARHGLWFSGDVLKLTRQYELEAQGIPREHAIAEAEKHIVNYRVPSEVLGSRIISRIMQDRRLTVFNRYHYGLLRSLGVTLRDAVKGTPAEKMRALDSMAMIATVMLGYHAVDSAVRSALGNNNAYVRRYGVFGLLHTLEQMMQNEKDPRDVVQRVMNPGPLLTLPVELLYGLDPYTGRSIVRGRDFWEHPTRWAKEVGSLLGSALYPLQQGIRVAEGKVSPLQMGLAQIGIYSPAPGQTERAQHFRKKDDIAFQRHLRKLHGE